MRVTGRLRNLYPHHREIQLTIRKSVTRIIYDVLCTNLLTYLPTTYSYLMTTKENHREKGSGCLVVLRRKGVDLGGKET